MNTGTALEISDIERSANRISLIARDLHAEVDLVAKKLGSTVHPASGKKILKHLYEATGAISELADAVLEADRKKGTLQ